MMMRNFLALPGLAVGSLLALGHPDGPAADPSEVRIAIAVEVNRS